MSKYKVICDRYKDSKKIESKTFDVDTAEYEYKDSVLSDNAKAINMAHDELKKDQKTEEWIIRKPIKV